MKNKSLLNRLITNDVSLMILSVLLALVIWFVINAGSDVESNVQISNIPINIELSHDAQNDDLQVFMSGDKNASVEVSGNRLIVGSLSSSDVQIYALDADFIKTPGYYNLELAAKKVSVKSNYSIDKVTPSSIRIYADRYKEKQLEIKDEIVYNVDAEHYVNSSMTEKVTVSGPETVINKIDRVVVQGEMDAELDRVNTDEFELTYLDKDSNPVDISLLELSVEKVTVSVEALPTKEIDLAVDFINKPQNCPDITFSVDRIKVAAKQSVLDKIENNTVVIGALDFSTLDASSHSIEYDLVLPTDCINISGIKQITVNVDLSNYYSRKIMVDTFRTQNIDTSAYSVKFNEGFEVTVYGPDDKISRISSDDIIANCDFKGKLDNVSQKVFSLDIPLVFSFNSEYKGCWVYGTYSALANVSQK